MKIQSMTRKLNQIELDVLKNKRDIAFSIKTFCSAFSLSLPRPGHGSEKVIISRGGGGAIGLTSLFNREQDAVEKCLRE